MTTSIRLRYPAEEHRSAAPLWVTRREASQGAQVPLSVIRELAAECGLGVSAVTTSDPFAGLQQMLESHIADGHMSGLDWFDRARVEVASDPRNLHPGARSVIAFGLPFYSGLVEKPVDEPRGRIARYAWGVDYHRVFRRRLKEFRARLEREVGRTLDARLLSDTARVVDRAVSARSGLGWYGKHSCIIVPGHGSWVMLGEMIVDLAIEQSPAIDHDCGSCSRCIDRCPTGAIVAPYVVDTPRCLSFQTIEQRGAIPLHLRPLLGDWVFGCDVCQAVCPYTAAAQVTDDQDFALRTTDHAFPRLHWLLEMSEPEFRAVFSGTAVLRAKRRGIARNAAIALGNRRDDASIPALAKALATHDEPLVRGHAAWALGQTGGVRPTQALERARRTEREQAALGEIELALDR